MAQLEDSMIQNPLEYSVRDQIPDAPLTKCQVTLKKEYIGINVEHIQ